MSNRDSSKYGLFYWCVGVPEAVAPDGEIYVHACRVEFCNGALILWSDNKFAGEKYEPRKAPIPILALAPGKWKFVYAASLMDGAAVGVEHWTGQIVEDRRGSGA